MNMTLEQFKKEGFVTNRPFSVNGKEYWVDKCMGGRYFSAFIGTKQITRATASTICKLIEADACKEVK